MHSTTPELLTSTLTAAEVLSADHRRFRRQVIEHCFASGTPIDRQVLTVILAAKAQREEPFRWWTAPAVRELLWVDIVEWCLTNAVDVPGNVPEAMWALLGALPVSDAQIAELREPLSQEAGLDRNGRRKAAKRRHPSRKNVS